MNCVKLLENACIKGTLQDFKNIHEEYKYIYHHADNNYLYICMAHAVKAGNLDIVKHILELVPHAIHTTFTDAAENKQLHILKYVLEIYPFNAVKVVYSLCLAGDFALFKQYAIPVLEHGIDNDTLTNACLGENIDIINYIIECPSIAFTISDYTHVLNNVIACANIDVINLLRAHGAEITEHTFSYMCGSTGRRVDPDLLAAFYRDTEVNRNSGMRYACHQGDENLIHHFHTLGARNYDTCLNIACEVGNLKIVQMLEAYHHVDNESWQSAFIHGCKHLHILEYIYSRAKTKLNINECLSEALESNYTDSFIWLLKINPSFSITSYFGYAWNMMNPQTIKILIDHNIFTKSLGNIAAYHIHALLDLGVPEELFCKSSTTRNVYQDLKDRRQKIVMDLNNVRALNSDVISVILKYVAWA